MRPDRSSPQIRATLEQLILAAPSNISWASLSRMLGQPGGYLRALALSDQLTVITPDQRGRLARFFGVEEWELGGPGEDERER